MGWRPCPGRPLSRIISRLPVQRIAARASLLAFFLATSVPALASAAFVGLIDAGSMVLSVVSLPVMVVGTIAGEKAGTRGSDRLHRALSIALLLVAIAMTSIGKGAIQLIKGRGIGGAPSITPDTASRTASPETISARAGSR